MTNENETRPPMRTTCCPCGCGQEHSTEGLSRRGFLAGVSGAGAVGVALSGLTWSAVATAAQTGDRAGPQRRALVVKPVLIYDIPKRSTSDKLAVLGRHSDAAGRRPRNSPASRANLDKIKSRADFPVEFAKPVGIRNASDVAKIEGLEKADVCIIYAAGGPQEALDTLSKRSKNMLLFCRHKSGPVYLWYEIISPRYLRQHTDALKVQGLDDGDVIVDNQDEILWRLRALCGLQNTFGTKILAIGGPGAWAQPADVVPNLVKKVWKFDIQTVSYEELGAAHQGRPGPTAPP